MSFGDNVVSDIVVMTTVAVIVVTGVVVVPRAGGSGMRVDMRAEVVSGWLTAAMGVTERRG